MKKYLITKFRIKYVLVTAALIAGLSAGVLTTSHSYAAGTLHLGANPGSSLAQAIADGFNLADITGSTSNPNTTVTSVNALPNGVQALIWVGNLDNTRSGTCAEGFTDAQFQALVNALAGNTKVFGYYVSDEPHPGLCPTAATDIKARADYIHTTAPGQKAFIVVLDGSNYCGSTLGCEYAALNPSQTDVDYIGLDPYPCHFDASNNQVPCDNTVITGRYNAATGNGVPQSAIVPLFQTFGQEGRTDGGSVYYRTPSVSELQSMLAAWAALDPNPPFDYAYSFGLQCGVSSCLTPQAIINHSELETVMISHNSESSSSGGVTGDLNGDGHVDVYDLSILLSHWKESGSGMPQDLNTDNVVNIFDLSILLSHYGT